MNYTVTITMTDETLLDLQANNYVLYGFATVASAPPAQAVVWFQTTEFSETHTLEWTDTYAVYTEVRQSVPGGGITGTNNYPLQPGLGQTLTVTAPTGIGTLSGTGEAGTVTVVNTTSTQLTCGLSSPAPVDGTSPQPLCSVPLFGHQEVVMTPGTAIFLSFDTMPMPVGSVMAQTYSEGVLIPVTPANPTAAVTFDINAGWSGAGTVYPPGTVLPRLSSSGGPEGDAGSDGP